MQNSIRSKCQAIWLKAYNEPITMQFPDKTSMHRARFTLYDALRKTDDSRFTRAKEDIEIRVNTAELILTIQKREENPFYDQFENVLESSLNGFTEKAIADDPAESLKRFQEKYAKRKREKAARDRGINISQERIKEC